MTAIAHEPDRRPWHLVAWVVALAGMLWLLAGLGDGPMSAPPLADPAALGEWYASRTPAEVLVSGVRLLALALGWYLMVVTALGALTRLLRLRRLVAVTDSVTLPAVRHLLRGTLGVGLAVAVVTSGAGPVGPLRTVTAAAAAPSGASVPAVGPEAALEAPPSVWGLPIDGPDRLPAPSSPEPGAEPSPSGPPAFEGVGIDWRDTEAHEHASGPDDAELPAPGEGGTPAEGSNSSGPEGAFHTIKSGEHLWAVAARTLEAHASHAPSETEVAAYWLELIDRNRDRLPDPTDPDLVHPGTVLALPPLPPS